jgi:hypothetical protein
MKMICRYNFAKAQNPFGGKKFKIQAAVDCKTAPPQKVSNKIMLN